MTPFSLANHATPTVVIRGNMNSNTQVYINSVVVQERDPGGATRVVYTEELDYPAWNQRSSAWDNVLHAINDRLTYMETGGKDGTGALRFDALAGNNTVRIYVNDIAYNHFFKVDQESQYKVFVEIKVDNPVTGGGNPTRVGPGVRYQHVTGLVNPGIAQLETIIKRYVDWSIEKNVPVFYGEWAAPRQAFSSDTYLGLDWSSPRQPVWGEGLGGEQYLEDMLTLIAKYELNSAMHVYKPINARIWGIYVFNVDNQGNTLEKYAPIQFKKDAFCICNLWCHTHVKPSLRQREYGLFSSIGVLGDTPNNLVNRQWESSRWPSH
jgi:hypothetical protein